MQTWDTIVREHAANVFGAALRVLGNRADAEDVSQEVFVEAFRKFRLRDDHVWGGLLKSIAVRRAIDLLRKGRRLEKIETLHEAVGDPSGVDPASRLIASELEERLRESLRELPPVQAEIFCLVFFEKMSHDEIAGQTGRSKNAVAAALSKARRHLEKSFRKTVSGDHR
ncbi:MAG: sigma-70 family RNA polymerase sigma factor [Planctomycetota bacterium]